MKVKIVILNWNGRAHLERFLPSVVAHSKGASIVVADNGSNDDSVSFVRKHYPQVELLLLDRNYGFAEGYNRALSQIEADCYVLLNSDVEVEEGWLDPLVARLEADERIAALAPKILAYERRSDFEYAGAAGGFLDCFGYPFCRGRILDTIEKDRGQYDTAREVFWASGESSGFFRAARSRSRWARRSSAAALTRLISGCSCSRQARSWSTCSSYLKLHCFSLPPSY